MPCRPQHLTIAQEVVQISHALGAATVQRLLPSHRRLIEAATAEVPNRVVAEDLPGRSGQDRLVGLGAQTLLGCLVLVLVSTLDEKERHSLRPLILAECRAIDGTIGVDAVHLKPGLALPVVQR